MTRFCHSRDRRTCGLQEEADCDSLRRSCLSKQHHLPSEDSIGGGYLTLSRDRQRASLESWGSYWELKSSRFSLRLILIWGTLLILVLSPSKVEPNQSVFRYPIALAQDIGEEAESAGDDQSDEEYSAPDDCTLVMAPSVLPHENAGWGVFTLQDRVRGQPVTPTHLHHYLDDEHVVRSRYYNGDVVVHISDPNPAFIDSWKYAVENNYLWNCNDVGGCYEGQEVISHVPGIGMLANALPKHRHNILPHVPSYDEGGATRINAPTAGSITHYHNFTFFHSSSLTTVAGSELFLYYPDSFYEQRQHLLHSGEIEQDNDEEMLPPQSVWTRDISWLKSKGRCLDNVRAGGPSTVSAELTSAESPDKEFFTGAIGRGAFATRNLPENSIVLPVPVLLLLDGRPAMELRQLQQEDHGVEIDDDDEVAGVVHTNQLLLNYCFGHPNSTVLFLPYGPEISLVNHAPSASSDDRTRRSTGSNPTANVRLQWSKSSTLHAQGQYWLQQPLDDVRSHNRNHGLLFELVATRDIQVGEEILLDYGEDWEQAWKKHVKRWNPVKGARKYAPSYVYEDAIRTLRTFDELSTKPYPSNVFTSCFYRYGDHREEAEYYHTQTTPLKQFRSRFNDHPTSTKQGSEVTSYAWQQTRGIYELRHLRPCRVLKRDNSNPVMGTTFTVRIFNRPGLPDEERIPTGMVHVVNQVPRQAIRFSDKIYTTDQHLPNTFRHFIGIPDELFPTQWKDLLTKSDDQGAEESGNDGDVEDVGAYSEDTNEHFQNQEQDDESGQDAKNDNHDAPEL
jgi:hypothetical protein